MGDFRRLAHAVWECKYHIVWCPKYRFRILKGEIGKSVRTVGLNEEQIRKYVKWQLKRDRVIDQLKLWKKQLDPFSVTLQATPFRGGY